MQYQTSNVNHGPIAALNGHCTWNIVSNCLKTVGINDAITKKRFGSNMEYTRMRVLLKNLRLPYWWCILSLEWWLWWQFICLNCWMFEENAFRWQTIYSIHHSHTKTTTKTVHLNILWMGDDWGENKFKIHEQNQLNVCSLLIAHRLWALLFLFPSLMGKCLLCTSIFG